MAEFPSEIKGYFPICLCGRGAYGQVWLVSDVVGNRRALKVVSKSMLGGDWEREFKGLKLYQTKIKTHPNLLQIYHIEDCADFFYYTMEAADNLGDEQNYSPATLDKYTERYNLEHSYIIGIFEQLLNAVDALHEAGLVHRDIKPENIIFVDDVPKLSDIGLATSFTASLSLAGTQSFVPPELLSGETKLVKENAHETDIYALGKPLYCVFTGLDATHYPLVPPAKLKAQEDRQINRAVKALCHSSHAVRLKTSDKFRHALEGHVGFGFWVRSFLIFLWKLISAPYRLLGLIFKNAIIRNLIFLLLMIAAAWGVYHLYKQYRQQQLLSSLAASGMLSVEEEKDYAYLSRKSELTNEETKRLQKLTEKIKQLAQIVNVEGDMEVGDSSAERRMHKLVYREEFSSLANWNVKSDDKPYLSGKSIAFNATSQIDMILDKITLPDEYEINFSINYPQSAPSLHFTVYAPQSVDYSDGRARHVPPENRNPASYNWPIGDNGSLGPATSRQISGAGYTLPNEVKPNQEFLHPGTHRMSIIKTGNHARIYLNGKMLYSPIFFTWPGGKFRILSFGRGSKTVEFSDLTIYDIGKKNSGKNEFKEPQPGKSLSASPVYQKLPYLPYRDYLSHFDADDWKIYNPASLRMSGGMAKLSGEIMFAFRHGLPSYYQMNFSVKRPTSGIILLKFFKELPEAENIMEAFWSQPGLTVAITSYTYAFYQTSPTAVCRADNAIPLLSSDHIGLSGKVSIARADGVLIVNNRFIIGDDEILGKYPAFYIYGCTDNPMRNLEIIQEYPFDLTHFTQSYFDSISLSPPKLKDDHKIPCAELILESKAPVTGDRLQYLLPGMVYHSEKLKPAVSDILKNLPPVSSKTFADWLDGSSGLYFNGDIYGSWAVFGKKYNTPEKYNEALSPGVREISEKLGIPWSSAMEIMKKRYPMYKE